MSAVAALAALAAAALLGTGGPQGAYRATLSMAELRAAGASAREAGWDAGTWTLTLAGSRWTLRQSGGRYGDAVDRGTVAVSGARAAFTLRSADGFPHNEDVGTLTWRTAPDGLRFAAAVRSRNADVIRILSTRAWARI